MTATQLTMDDALEAAGQWADQALLAVRALASTGRAFQCWDLVENFGLTEPPTTAAWGALMRRAKAQGIVRRVGYAPSKRPETRGSAVAVWVGR